MPEREDPEGLASDLARKLDTALERLAGVDLIRARRGPLVLEVNASPGLEGIEAATGVDIAGKIVDLLEKGVKKSSSSKTQKR